MCAARNLENFFFVGIVERMQDSLCLLSNLLNWDIQIDDSQKWNPSDHATTTDEDINHMVKWDRRLWHLGSRKLDEGLGKLPPGRCAPPLTPPPPKAASPPPEGGWDARIKKLAELKAAGALTADEFAAVAAQVVAKS